MFAIFSAFSPPEFVSIRPLEVLSYRYKRREASRSEKQTLLDETGHHARMCITEVTLGLSVGNDHIIATSSLCVGL